VIGMALVLLGMARDRAAALRAAPLKDRGASALEWAIIAAVVVVAASIIGGVIFTIVQNKGSKLTSCAAQPVGAACTP
jgi:Flp pilus assembly pilin Flp